MPIPKKKRVYKVVVREEPISVVPVVPVDEPKKLKKSKRGKRAKDNVESDDIELVE